MREVVCAYGHEHVRTERASIFGATVNDWLTSTGNCIIGAEAERTPTDFDSVSVEVYQSHNVAIDVHVYVDTGDEAHERAVHAHGHLDLMFEDDHNIIFRTSDYVDNRTDAVDTTHTTTGFDHDLVSALADGVELIITIEVE